MNDSVSIPIRRGSIKQKPNMRLHHPATLLLSPIQSAVAEEFGLNAADLMTGGRAEYIAWPRMVAMALGYSQTECSLHVIAQYWHKKDHATVIHAIRRVQARWETDKQQREKIERIKNRLGA